MRNMFDRIDNGGYYIPLLLALVVILIIASMASRSHTNHDAATREVWRRRFEVARRNAESLFEDPKIPRDDPVHFWAAKNALEIWATWQGRPLSDLKLVVAIPSEDEWHALSLINALSESNKKKIEALL